MACCYCAINSASVIVYKKDTAFTSIAIYNAGNVYAVTNGIDPTGTAWCAANHHVSMTCPAF